MARILGLITARGGSKGIPGKNVKPLGGKPLVSWTARAARASGVLDRLVVSTDSEEIAAVCREEGVEVPFLRPAHLAGDRSAHFDVVLHALDALSEGGYAPDLLLLLQPTSPFRTPEDIRGAAALLAHADAPAVVSVTEATHPQLLRHLDEGGALVPAAPPRSGYLRRQDLERTYRLNGAVYLVRVVTLRSEGTFTPAGTLAWVMPAGRSLDLDTAADWALAEYHARALEDAP